MYTQNVILMTQQVYAQSTTSRTSSTESAYDKSFQETISEKTQQLNEENQPTDTKQSNTEDTDKVSQTVTEQTSDKVATDEIDVTPHESSEREVFEAVQDEILQLLATQLNVPVEQIQSLLQEQGKNVLQLLNQDTFMSFIQTTMGIDQQGLLEDTDRIKQISSLWESIQEIVANSDQETLQVILDKMEHSVTIGSTEILSPQTDNAIDVVETTPVVPSEVTAQSIEDSEGNTEIEVTTTEGIAIKDSTTTFILPIENMLETQSARLWQQQTQQTTGMKHTEHAPVNKQIVEQVDFLALREGKELTVELNPRELGKLTLQVSEHNGVITTVIKVESERTKELLIENLAVLKENLEQQGLEVGQFQVDVKQNKSQEQMMQQKQKSSKRIQEIIDKHMGQVEGDMVAQETTPETSESALDLKA